MAAHPLSERLHAQRMLALYRSGRQAEALAAYRHARRVLVDEIGVEPGAELRRPARRDPAPGRRRAGSARGRAAACRGAPPVAADRRAPPVAARTPGRRVLVAVAALVLVGGLAIFAVEPLERARATSAHRGERGRPDRPRIGADHGAVRGRARRRARWPSGGGSVWVANAGDGTVSRIERGRDQIVTIPVGEGPADLAFAAGSLWVTDRGGARVADQPGGEPGRAQDRRGQRAAWHRRRLRGPVGGLRGRPHGRPDRPQARSGDAEDRSRREPDGARRRRRRGVGHERGGRHRVSDRAALGHRGEHDRRRPRPGRRRGRRRGGVGREPPGRDGLARSTRRPTRSPTPSRWDAIRARSRPATAGCGWRTATDGTVSRIDPVTRRTAETIAVEEQSERDRRRRRQRCGPRRSPRRRPIAAERCGWRPTPSATTASSLPATATSRPYALLSLAYDGLVAYRRAGGATFGTLVGDLATEVPRPSPDGRTYVFTLRPNLRYSDGTPVRPQDFRASLEDAAPPPPRGAAVLPGDRRRAGGARDGPRSCDLSAGIVTDARRADDHDSPDRARRRVPPRGWPSPLAFVAPAAHPFGGAQPPGTGPYRIVSYDREPRGAARPQPAFPGVVAGRAP